MWLMVWGSPHEQFGVPLVQRCFAGTRPVWKQFNKDHEQRGRTKWLMGGGIHHYGMVGYGS